MDYNDIKYVNNDYDDVDDPFLKLSHLSLQHNRIEEINHVRFAMMLALETLDLRHNRIHRITWMGGNLPLLQDNHLLCSTIEDLDIDDDDDDCYETTKQYEEANPLHCCDQMKLEMTNIFDERFTDLLLFQSMYTFIDTLPMCIQSCSRGIINRYD